VLGLEGGGCAAPPDVVLLREVIQDRPVDEPDERIREGLRRLVESHRRAPTTVG
jgi:hypothetical protein